MVERLKAREKVELTQSAYSRIELGVPTTTTTIEAIARVLGIPVADAMENTHGPATATAPCPTEESGPHPMPTADDDATPKAG